MSYYKVLGFELEPFSTSPDPKFFYLSKGHKKALTNILIELRLKRGLSVILGDIGTGKTTLSRKLIQELKEREDFLFYIMLDPSFDSEYLFLSSLARNFGIAVDHNLSTVSLDLRETLEKFLFQKGVVENKTVVLIIDEAQKLNEKSLEALRIFLNYETNEFKLLQLALLGQMELLPKIMNIMNFYDRISFEHILNPLDYEETKEMIHFRIKEAGYNGRMELFTEDAIKKIHMYTGGYPRQITMLCHKALKELYLKNCYVINDSMIDEIDQHKIHPTWHKKNPILQKVSC